MFLYDKKVQEEQEALKGKRGPLERAILKDINYVIKGDSGVKNDYAGDNIYTINDENTILHKYDNRLLVLVTKNCVKSCAYCFRQINLETSIEEEKEHFEKLVNQVILYLSNHLEINEVILSGGDPITLGYEKLKYFFEKIRNMSNINDIRLHTRAIVYEPSLITKDIIELLNIYNVRIVFHIIHPYEICEIVKEKICEIICSGVRCYNQFPLLRNINDNIEVISKLLFLLDMNHVRNLTIFIPDPIILLEEYRVSIKRILEIAQQLETSYPAWISATRFVFDSANGKVSISNLVEIDEEKNIAVFVKNGKKVIFPDLPQSIDVKGDLVTMLWNY